MIGRTAPEKLAFDSDAVPELERLERYRAIYGFGADILATGPQPRMAFEGWRLDAALLYHRSLHDIGHRRTSERVAQDGLGHWTVTLVFEGSLAIDWGQGRSEIRPNELVFMNAARPASNDAKAARIATLSIAEQRLADIVGPLDGLHGVILAPDDCRLYADFVRSLLTNLPTMSKQSLTSITSALCTLLKVALDAHGRGETIAAPGRNGARIDRLRLLIDTRLGDPHFDADCAIAESGLSRATLYRMLRTHRGLASYIQVRRLEYIRRALSDANDTRPLATIAAAAGFATESYASRAFLAHYGLRPGKYRITAISGRPIDNQSALFRSWQDDLN